LLTITANGSKLPPLLIFKSKKGGNLEKSLKKYKEVINGNAFMLAMKMHGAPMIL
jgi:hypothetical protein